MRMVGSRAAAGMLLVALAALAVFHVLMLLGVLPAGIAWGGRAGDTPQRLALLEAAGLVVTAIFALIVAVKGGYVARSRSPRAVGVAMWAVFGYFVLNVFGNLASTSALERAIFVPVSIVLALLALRVAIDRTDAQKETR